MSGFILRILTLFIGVLLGAVTSADAAARAEVRRADGANAFSAELGSVVDMEVFIDSGDEALTGYSLFVSYDAEVFSLVPAEVAADGAAVPFSSGTMLRGIPLVNSVEEIDGRVYLSYVEAAGGSARLSADSSGVVLRFKLEVARRSVEGIESIRLEELGHDRISHYVTADEPGIEKRFAQPLGAAQVRITGFRIWPIPDVTVVEGQSQVVFDLDQFVDTLSTEVLWTHSRLSEVPTAIDPDTREVTMSPRDGFVGRRAMIFTAFDIDEGLTAADTVRITVLSTPLITDFPDTIRFAEDSLYLDLDFDAFAEDLDHDVAELTWQAAPTVHMEIDVNADSHVALFSPMADFFGIEEVTFIVADPTGLADTVVTVVEVLPVNDPPEVESLPPVYPVVGGPSLVIPIEDILSDRDDAVSVLQVFLEVEGGVRAELADGNLLVGSSQAGRGIVHITAQDTSGASASTRLVVIGLEEGTSVGPELDRLAEVRFRGGQSVALDLKERVKDDSPAELLIWSVQADSGLVASILGGVLQISGESGFAGSAHLVVEVTDPEGNSDAQRLLASVLRSEDDLGPRIAAVGKIGLREDEVVRYALDEWVADPDHADDAINWEIYPTAGVEATLDVVSRTLSVWATDDFASPAELGLRAIDPQGNSHEATVPVLLARSGEAPQLAALPEVSLDSANAAVQIDLDDYAYDDVDRESELVWQVVAEPGVRASFDPVTHDLVLERDESAGNMGGATQVLLRAMDTNGQERTALITVGLPPLFSLLALPDVELFVGRVDSTVVLQDYAVGGGGSAPPSLVWSVGPAEHISAEVDVRTTRLFLLLTNAGFTGTEVLQLSAVDATGRRQVVPLQVVVNGPGLAPQVRSLPRIEVAEGEVDASLDLDDYVVDDDPDDALVWSVSGQQVLAVSIDPATRVVTLDATEATPAIEKLQFVVIDPSGNTELAVMEVVVVRGGAAPVIGALPQMLLTAGDAERQIDLSVFVQDADTPSEDLRWDVQAPAGISARLEGSRLFVAIPPGQRGQRSIALTVTDSQGNLAVATMQVIIELDGRPPEFRVEVGRDPVFSEWVEIIAVSDEMLLDVPIIAVEGDTLDVKVRDDGKYQASFYHGPDEEDLFVEAVVRGVDRAGNEGVRRQEVALDWFDKKGGNVRSPDLQLLLNVSDAAAQPGQMAIIYRLGAAEQPPNSGGYPVYSIDMLDDRALAMPVTINFLTLGDAPQGVLRWDETTDTWNELATSVDPQTGWLAVTVDELGLFRTGRVRQENIRQMALLNGYPNPFVAGLGEMATIEYNIVSPGPVRMMLYNALGQPVRVLIDEFQEVGVWSVGWNGRDTAGSISGSGVYYIELIEGGRRHRRSLVLLR